MSETNPTGLEGLDPLVTLTALQMAEKLRAGEITSEQLTRAHLDRIEQVNGVLNAFLVVDAEGALAAAKEVDAARAAGEELHPLAGVPIALGTNAPTAPHQAARNLFIALTARSAFG